MIGQEIELFRVGGAASRGITAANLAEVAEHDCATSPVALCFGHPKNDTPAAGTISKLRASGNSLFGTIGTATQAAIDGIKSGAWINRSMAFFDPTHEANPSPGKWRPRHVGLLGGAAPGIPGMGTLQKAFSFAADGETLEVSADPADAVIYSGAPTPTHYVFESKEPVIMADKTPEQIEEDKRLKAEDDRLKAERTAFEARVTSQFEASNGGVVDGLVAAGKLLPTEVSGLKLVFNALGRDELEFGAADKPDKATASAKLGAFLSAALPKRVDTSGERLSPSGEFDAGDKGKSGDDFRSKSGSYTAQARELMDKDKSLTFEAAIERVSGGGHVN